MEPVSADIRRVGARVRTEHHTVGVVRTLPGDVVELDCACGVTLTNGPGWSLDEHLQMDHLLSHNVARLGEPRALLQLAQLLWEHMVDPHETEIRLSHDQ